AHALLLVSLLVLLLAGCASHVPAPIEQKSIGHTTNGAGTRAPRRSVPHGGAATYNVVAGDTLYSIAWRLGLDPHALARRNRITDPNRIAIGQILQLPASAGVVTPQRLREPPPRAAGVEPRAAPPTLGQASLEPTASANKEGSAHLLRWRWPADGRATRAVSSSGSIGLEIKGQRGQPIKATEGGEVVYSGNGLRGYGQLLIIKHDEKFLSAYAHNDKLLVAEGQRVESGQAIALMGDSEAREVMLHFEIRKDGKAVEPLRYRPQR
ncbi:MAG: peptidoglycan DD-metalloendopeptidase family protein, partial [Gammaproteobacteria bacterium]